MDKPILEYTKTELADLIAYQWKHWCDDHDITPELVTVLPDSMTQRVMFDCDHALYDARLAAYGHDVTQVYTIQPENVHRIILWLNPRFPEGKIAIPRANVPYGETPVKAKKPAEHAEEAERIEAAPVEVAKHAEEAAHIEAVPIAEAAPLAEVAKISEVERAKAAKLAEAEKAATEAEKIATDAAKKEDENVREFANAQAEASKRSDELEKALELVKISPEKGSVKKNARKHMGEKKKIADKATANVIAAEASLKKATEEARRTKQVALELRAIADALARAREVAEESAAEAKKVVDTTTADAEIAEDKAEDAELIATDAEMRVDAAEETARYAAAAVVIEEMGLTVPNKALPDTPRAPFRVVEAAPNPEMQSPVAKPLMPLAPVAKPRVVDTEVTLRQQTQPKIVVDGRYRKIAAECVAREIDAESRRLCPWVFDKEAYFVDIIDQIGDLSAERMRLIAGIHDAGDIINAIDNEILSVHDMSHLVLWRALAKHIGSRQPITALSVLIGEFNPRDLEECRNLAMVDDVDITCMAAAASAAIQYERDGSPVIRKRFDMTKAQCKSQFFELGKYVNAPGADAYFAAQIRGWSSRNQQEFLDSIEAKRNALEALDREYDVYIDGVLLAEFIADLA